MTRKKLNSEGLSISPLKKANPDKLESADKEVKLYECYIHSETPSFEVSEIRQKVCVKNKPLIEFEGNYYCLFHLPTDEKDTNTFVELVKERFAETEKQIDELDKLSKNEKKDKKEDTYYNFAYVWFPSNFSFSNYRFRVAPDFGHATFSKGVYFKESVFEDWAYFESTNFLSVADFSDSKFMVSPHFENASFRENANFFNTIFENGANFLGAKFVSPKFNRAIFNGKSDFSYTEFEKYTSFDTSEFNGKTDFSSARFNDFTLFVDAKFKDTCYFAKTRFSKNCETRFSYASFSKDVYFLESIFRENVRFAFVNFESDSNIFFRNIIFRKKVDFQGCVAKGYLTFDNLRLGKNCMLAFSEAAFENALRVSFNTLKLNPIWFINADVRKFIFTNVNWENFELSKLKFQLKILEEEKVKNSKSLLKITCRQLAENAENNNRFEEASKFRQIAFECERLERIESISKWKNTRVNYQSVRDTISEKANTFPYDFVHWLYRWTSGYGENRLWAFFVLVLIVIIPAILYATPLCEFPNGQNGVRSLGVIEAFAYSLRVMVLQRPEPFPINDFGKIVLALESVFAPLQLALLALAIRRKFMR